jgi:hypothetical protein
LNETRFGPKNKLSPIYLGPKISTLFDALDEREIARYFQIIPKVNFCVETKILVSMSEEIK